MLNTFGMHFFIINKSTNMASFDKLFGPPEAFLTVADDGSVAKGDDSKLTAIGDGKISSLDSVSPFMDLMIRNYNDADDNFPPGMGLTENNSLTFLTTGNSCLDFFFQVVPGADPETVTALLEKAWNDDPLTAMKLVCNLRGVRGTGKSDKEGFYTCAVWIHKNHPKTLAENLRWISDFGYIKDLPEILYQLIERPEVRITKYERMAQKRKKFRFKKIGKANGKILYIKIWNEVHKIDDKSKLERRKYVSQAKRVLEEKERVEKEKWKAREVRKQRIRERARRAVEKYENDEDYKYLHDKISIFFAETLKSDLGFLNSGEIKKISLAAKWCPSLNSSYDLHTLLCENIARRVFPYDPSTEIEERHHAYRVRDRLRKEVLVPLRSVLELPEVYMSANQWNKIPYNRVVSVAMKNYKKLFQKHDKDRFSEYLERVKAGKSSIAAGALLPHEILTGAGDDVAELQWKRMIEDMSKIGKLKNSIAVCDVSGSMHGEPLEVCIALGLVVSELSEEPWKGAVITFSEHPELHKIGGETLVEKTQFVRNMNWGMNTDFQQVFDRILTVAINGKLEEEQMINRVFVFSDMEFDQASTNSWETDYMAIQRKFQHHGYKKVPKLVFWNLRESRSIPVQKQETGIALVSGFSKNLLKMFMNNGGEGITPEDVMKAAISDDEYEKLAVFD